MKKIFLFAFSIFFSAQIFGQAKPQSGVVDASMPRGSRLLTKEQVINFTSKNYKNSQISPSRKNIYQLDGLLISFWDLSINPEFKKSLEASQQEMGGILKLDPEIVMNYSKIVKFNGVRFLIYEYQKSDEVFLRFQSEFDRGNKNICGIIQFKKPDEDKAQAALQEFLNSIRFKNM